MDLQERYDELEKIIEALDDLVGEITYKKYIEALESIKNYAQDELDEIEPDVFEESNKEKERQLKDYYNSVL